MKRVLTSGVVATSMLALAACGAAGSGSGSGAGGEMTIVMWGGADQKTHPIREALSADRPTLIHVRMPT